MTTVDIGIFQVLAALFTVSFIVLCFSLLRFMHGLEQGRHELLRIARRMEEEWRPILEDLRAGAAGFRETGELARNGAEKFSELGDQVGRLTALTKWGGSGVWGMLKQVAGAFTSK